ncbi:MAG: serine/threonine-protein kinase [Myxococcota bacterium]
MRSTCSVCGAELAAGRCPRGHVDPLDLLTVPSTTRAPPLTNDAPTVEHELPAETRIAADPLLPDVVGGFRLDFVAGTGGMGTVYRAHDERLGTAVALKVMRLSAASDERALTRSLREATAAARVQHPAIPPVLGHGLLPDGRPWMATPFLEGAPLDRLLAEAGRLEWALAVPVLAELSSALAAAHAAGVVHRDVKPSNVFLARHSDGTVGVKLIDFGLALLGDAAAGVPQTSVQSAAGTADFTAPEQALGQAVGAWTDLYALGITAFQLLTGRLPFRDTHTTAILRRQVFEEPPPLGEEVDVPRALASLVGRLLAKQPQERPRAASEVRAALEELPAPAAGDQGLLGDLARQWSKTHPPRSLIAQLRSWWTRSKMR